MNYRARLCTAIVAAALLAAILPLASATAGVGVDAPKADSGGSLRAQAATAPPDVYELGPGDDSMAAARDITAHLPRQDAETPGWGMEPYTETHTIDIATGGSWEEDWVKFTVSAADYASWTQLSYMIDAHTPDWDTDLVIDVYGPGYNVPKAANTTPATDAGAVFSNDDSPWTDRPPLAGRFSQAWLAGGTGTKFTGPGTYWVRVRPYWNTTFTENAGTYQLRIKPGQVTRLAGSTRIETAVRISQETRPTYAAKSQEASVVIAYGWGYADALAGASLAGAGNGPILLTPADHLPASVGAEIRRLGVKGAYVIGGSNVVHNTVIEDLQIYLDAPRIRRISGADRVQTSLAVMRETKKVLGTKSPPQSLPRTAFVAYGWNYPDALALSPASYYDAVPVLLTHQASLDATLVGGMFGNFDDAVIAGSGSVVGTQVATDLTNYVGIPGNRILRIGGRDRYETAKEIASWACDLKGPGPRVNGSIGTTGGPGVLGSLPNPHLNAYASGQNYPDALAGGPLAGNAGAPLLLTYKDYDPVYLFGADGEMPPGATQWFADLANNGKDPIRRSYLLGGTGAISNGCFSIIDNNTGAASP